jgi:hypothetical protein
MRHAYGNANGDGHIHSNGDCHIHSDGDCDGNIYCDGYGNSHSHGNSNSDCDRIAAVHTDAATSADTAASPLALFAELRELARTDSRVPALLHWVPSSRTARSFQTITA